MKEFTKKVFAVGLTLCLIGAGSALLISGVNAITKDKIAQNEIATSNRALEDIYDGGDYASIDIDVSSYNYVKAAWSVSKDNVEVGYIFKTSGKNAYGEISMMVGVYTYNYQVITGRISLITNTETYGDKLVDDYVNPYLSGDSSLNDVTCGATYGAKLIRDMADEAVNVYMTLKGLGE